jgi:hypothetical protein
MVKFINKSMDYIWKYNHPKFNVAKQKNNFKWGFVTAKLEEFNLMHEVVWEFSFCLHGDCLKTYTTREAPTNKWVDKHIKKFFDSKVLDLEIQEEGQENYIDIVRKYRDLTGSLR